MGVRRGGPLRHNSPYDEHLTFGKEAGDIYYEGKEGNGGASMDEREKQKRISCLPPQPTPSPSPPVCETVIQSDVRCLKARGPIALPCVCHQSIAPIIYISHRRLCINGSEY